MPKAVKEIELDFQTSNEIGILAKITGALAKAGVNLKATCAYGEGGTGFFMLVTSDSKKAKEVIKGLGYQPGTKEVLAIQLHNRPGALAEIAEKMRQHDLNINYMYASATEGGPALVIFHLDELDKAIQVLN